MTLHVMTAEHHSFLTDCFQTEGYSMGECVDRANEIMDVALGYAEPLFFVGPSSESPKYVIGAYLDVTQRAYLFVTVKDLDAVPSYPDAVDWLDYLLIVLGVRLLEVFVWVEDLKKEWFLRAIGFKKAGVIPEKLDIPGRPPQTALSMYIRPVEFQAVSKETFRATIKKYKAHRDRLKKERE